MIPTVSLTTARALKEAGYDKETLFNWQNAESTDDYGYHKDLWCLTKTDEIWNEKYQRISAPCSDEILEELPEHIPSGHRLVVLKIEKEYCVAYQALIPMSGLYTHVEYCNESLPEALAAMWLYLKKEGLLNDKERG